jgi:hypothetical protein
MAPRGRSGGMILGIHLLSFDIREIEEGVFLYGSRLDIEKMILNLI